MKITTMLWVMHMADYGLDRVQSVQENMVDGQNNRNRHEQIKPHNIISTQFYHFICFFVHQWKSPQIFGFIWEKTKTTM